MFNMFTFESFDNTQTSTNVWVEGVPLTGIPWGLLIITTSLSWYSTRLWRCFARTLGWTRWSCWLYLFISASLFCCLDIGASTTVCFFLSWRTFSARSAAVRRCLTPVTVASPRLWHGWQYTCWLNRDVSLKSPKAQSHVGTILTQLFIIYQHGRV